MITLHIANNVLCAHYSTVRYVQLSWLNCYYYSLLVIIIIIIMIILLLFNISVKHFVIMILTNSAVIIIRLY